MFPKPGICIYNCRHLRGLICTARGRVVSVNFPKATLFVGDGILDLHMNNRECLTVNHCYTVIGRVSQGLTMLIMEIRPMRLEGDSAFVLYANTLKFIHQNISLVYPNGYTNNTD